nr:MAG TPA: hypothetical protein [Caudoviricetes sp.]
MPLARRATERSEEARRPSACRLLRPAPSPYSRVSRETTEHHPRRERERNRHAPGLPYSLRSYASVASASLRLLRPGAQERERGSSGALHRSPIHPTQNETQNTLLSRPRRLTRPHPRSTFIYVRGTDQPTNREEPLR